MKNLPSVTADDVLRRKCRQALYAHRRRALVDMRKLPYGLMELVALAKGSPVCAYCRMPVGWDFQFDHRTPTARTPQAHALTNLCIACGPCNQMKGQMDAEEYHRLLTLLDGFHPSARADVRRRLIAGGSRYRQPRGQVQELG